MTPLRMSDKGQITIPAAVRRKLGMRPGSSISLEVRDEKVVLSVIPSISDVAGIFRDRVRGKDADWDAARRHAEAAVARQVANE